MKHSLPLEALPLDEKFKKLFEEYKRNIQEQLLYDILVRFYFADWIRACDYEKMTSEQLVDAVMEVCKGIEKTYNYNLDDDINPNPFSGPFFDIEE